MLLIAFAQNMAISQETRRRSVLQLATIASVLRQPEVEPFSYSLQTLFLRITYIASAIVLNPRLRLVREHTLVSILQIPPKSKTMLYTLEQLDLEHFLLGLHNVNGSIPELIRESVIDLRA